MQRDKWNKKLEKKNKQNRNACKSKQTSLKEWFKFKKTEEEKYNNQSIVSRTKTVNNS